MTAITEEPREPISRPLSDPLGRLTLFRAPAAATAPAAALRDSDRGEQAMHRLRNPFAAE